MQKWKLDPDKIAELADQQARLVEAEVIQRLEHHGLTLSFSGEEGLHSAVVEAMCGKLEAEGALEFLARRPPGTAQ